MTTLQHHFDHSYTKFNSKELFRAFREFSANEFIVYLTMVRLITQYNSKKNFRKISTTEILDELPINISLRSLNKYLKNIFDKQFITKFLSPEDRVNVYSLAQKATNQNYSLIENYILTDVCAHIDNAAAFKTYTLIFCGLILFKKDIPFKKSLSDIARMMGQTPTKGIKDSITSSLKTLEDLNLIECFTHQKHFFQKKLISFSVNLWWRKQLPSEQIESEESQVCSEHSRLGEVVQINRQPKADFMIGECKNDDTYTLYKKKIELIKENEFKRISSDTQPEYNTESDTSKSGENLLIFKYNHFNFYGLDKLDNPMTKKSINSFLKHSNLTIEQIQRSVMLFSEYINSPLCTHTFNDPIAILFSHFQKFGEYIPPEEYLKQAHKLEHQLPDGVGYDDLIIHIKKMVEKNGISNNIEYEEEQGYEKSDDQESSPKILISIKLVEQAKNKLEDLCRTLCLNGVVKKQLLKNHIENAVRLIEKNTPITIENLGSVAKAIL